VNASQTAHDAVTRLLSTLCGLQDLVDDPIARIAQEAGIERQDGLPALRQFAADLSEGLKAVAPLLPEAEAVWAEARRQRGPIRLCGEAHPTAHELAIALACKKLNGLRLATAAIGEALSPGWTPEAITLENLPAVYRVLSYRRLEREDLDALWAELDWEQAAIPRQHGVKAEVNQGDASAKGGDERVLRLLESMGPEQARIVSVAGDKSKTVEHRMMEIAAIDRAYLGKDSEGWAALLGCSSAAIRKTAFWAQIQSEPDAAYRDAVEMTRPL